MLLFEGEVDQSPDEAPEEPSGIGEERKGEGGCRRDVDGWGCQHENEEVFANSEAAWGDREGGDADDHGNDQKEYHGVNSEVEPVANDPELKDAGGVEEHRYPKGSGEKIRFFAEGAARVEGVLERGAFGQLSEP